MALTWFKVVAHGFLTLFLLVLRHHFMITFSRGQTYKRITIWYHGSQINWESNGCRLNLLLVRFVVFFSSHKKKSILAKFETSFIPQSGKLEHRSKRSCLYFCTIYLINLFELYHPTLCVHKLKIRFNERLKSQWRLFFSLLWLICGHPIFGFPLNGVAWVWNENKNIITSN